MKQAARILAFTIIGLVGGLGCDKSPLFPDDMGILSPPKPPMAPDLAVYQLPDMMFTMSSPDLALPGRTLIWHDEFDGNAGDAPNPAYWANDVGGSGWGNAQLEYDTAGTHNVALDGYGHLAITARAESYMGHSYTSGRIETGSRFSHLYGRFEASMKMPRGQGMWPAFWLLGQNGAGWPDCGEIDIVETRGQVSNTANGSVHGPGYSGANAATNHLNVTGAPLWDNFHVYAVEWFPDHIVFSVDGITYETVTPNTEPGKQWVFNDHPFDIIFDLAVGGNYVGSPDASTMFPQTLLVDYVRVYEALQ